MPNTRESSTQIFGPKSSSQSPTSDPAVIELQRVIAKGEEFILATGTHARQFSGDLEELRNHRLTRAGGSVFKRDRSRYWQLKYQVNGKWRYETTRLEDRQEAERLLADVEEGREFVVPVLWTFEIANGLLMLARRKLLTTEQCGRARRDLLGLNPVIDEDGPRQALAGIADLAERYTLSVYDGAYLELALRRRLPLASRDKALNRAARLAGVTLLL